MSVLFEQAVAPAAGQTAQRSAALLLHGMSEADRAWAWEQLGEPQRATLAPLLQELRELGVPRDQALVSELIAEVPPQAAPARTARERVAAADAVQVAQLLCPEPALLARRLLALGPWPWQSQVLMALRAQHGEALEPMSDERVVPAPALDEALLERMAERLPDAMPAATSPGAPWWQRLLRELPRMVSRATR